MTYTDLLGTPYKEHGRSREEGFDCYGLVLECCRRAGTPLADLDYKSSRVPVSFADAERGRLNVRRIDRPRPGCIVEMDCNGKAHVGYMADRYNVLHTTARGVRCAYIGAVKATGFYEVT